MIQKAAAVWATSDWQLHHNHVPTHASCLVQSFFGETSNHPGDSAPFSPDLVPCNFWLFPKLNSLLKGKRFQIIDETQENMMGWLMAIRRAVGGSEVPTLKGTEVSLSCVECFLYLGSSSINVSIFHSTWLNTFWIDLVLLGQHEKYIIVLGGKK